MPRHSIQHAEAVRALDHHEDELFRNENLTYLMVRRRGGWDGEYYLEAGLVSLARQQARRAYGDPRLNQFMPEALEIPAPGPPPAAGAGRYLHVEMVESGRLLEAQHDRVRPVGYPACIGRAAGNDNHGTLGALALLTHEGCPSQRHLITAAHVVEGVGTSILQPGQSDGGTAPADSIATVCWRRRDRQFDVAVAGMTLADADVGGGTDPLTGLQDPAAPELDVAVEAHGMTTPDAAGTIIGSPVTIALVATKGKRPLRKYQFATGPMLTAGDSGAILFESAATKRALGVFHTYSTAANGRCFYTPLVTVMAALEADQWTFDGFA